MTRLFVTVTRQGRITLPAALRRQIRLEEGGQLEVIVSQGEVRLRPAGVTAAEDAWAYTAENVAAIREARTQVSAGRVFRSSADDLEARLLLIKRRHRR